MKNQRRAIRFLFPALQSRFFTLALAGVGASLAIQAAVSAATLAALANRLPSDGEVVHGEIVGLLVRDLLWSFALTAPVFGLFVLIALMRVVGPFHRMQRFLEEVIDGRRPEPCRLREDDEFQEFCALLNRATGIESAAGAVEPGAARRVA